MSTSKSVIGSDLAKVDAHVIRSEEYDEIPELTDDLFDQADLYHGTTLVRRGRPKSANPKEAVNIRLDTDVVEHFRKSGPGWQTRINDLLRKVAGL
jgi:uncharacterized protein (DUF4415 family)